MDNIYLGKLAREKLEETFEVRGHANVLIAGRTGVGKSTLNRSGQEHPHQQSHG